MGLVTYIWFTCSRFRLFFCASLYRLEALWRQASHLIHIQLSLNALPITKISTSFCRNQSYIETSWDYTGEELGRFSSFHVPSIGQMPVCVHKSHVLYDINDFPWKSFCNIGHFTTSTLISLFLSSVMWKMHTVLQSLVCNNTYPSNICQVIKRIEKWQLSFWVSSQQRKWDTLEPEFANGRQAGHSWHLICLLWLVFGFTSPLTCVSVGCVLQSLLSPGCSVSDLAYFASQESPCFTWAQEAVFWKLTATRWQTQQHHKVLCLHLHVNLEKRHQPSPLLT